MLRTERFVRFGSCVLLATLAAIGCDEANEEVLETPGSSTIVTPDTSTSRHSQPSLSPDGTIAVFSTDWRFDGIERDARDLAVINVPPPGEPYGYSAQPETISAASFRPITYPAGLSSDAPGGNTTRFDPTEFSKEHPVWNPTNGNQLVAVIQNQNRLDRIYLLDVDLSDPTEVTVTNDEILDSPAGREYFYFDPTFSADGQWVAFSRFFFRLVAGQNEPESEPQAIYVINLASRQVYQLTDGSSEERSPSFSPDGRKIAFHSNRSSSIGVADIYTINFDPANPGDLATLGSITRLTFANQDARGPTFLPESNEDPSWSPSGGKIAFMSSRRAPATSWRDRNLWWMNADGTEQAILVFSRTDDQTPMFSPFSSSILLYSSSDHPLDAFNNQRADIYLLTGL